MTIEQAAVLGAGVMGAQIAAHFANAGIPVQLLDVVPQGTEAGMENRNALAEGAVQKMLKTQPAPFVSKRAARLVACGNLEDHLERLGGSRLDRRGGGREPGGQARALRARRSGAQTRLYR